MKHQEVQSWRALLLELGELCDAAERCAVATEYNSPRADSMKKFHRSDADLGVWLDRIEACHARVKTFRAAIFGQPQTNPMRENDLRATMNPAVVRSETGRDIAARQME